MVFNTNELSTFDGKPIRLYRFSLGLAAEWLYTTADRFVAYAGKGYNPIAISDDGLKQKGESTSDDFTITMPSTEPLIRMYRGTPPAQPVRLEMRELHYGDDEAPLMWVGYVSSVKYKDAVVSDVVCNTQTAYMNRKGLRLAYTRACPYALYDQDCKVVPSAWGENVTITSLVGNGFTYTPANQFARWNGRHANGYMEWGVAVGYTERRAILYHDDATSTIVLLGLTDGLVNGQMVTLYPGCQRNPTDCKRFNNISNYGGFPMMPGKSPFDGDPVF